jgi:hypothetical protein
MTTISSAQPAPTVARPLGPLPTPAVVALGALGVYLGASVLGIVAVVGQITKRSTDDDTTLVVILAVTGVVMALMIYAGWLVAAKRAVVPLRVIAVVMLVLSIIAGGLMMIVNVAMLLAIVIPLGLRQVREYFGSARSAHR